MELIIRGTNKCNFNCSFCHAWERQIDHLTYIPEQLQDFIIQNNPSQIIVTGGQPLLLPEIFWKQLLEIYDGPISFQSNLYLFKQDPEKFRWLFTDSRVSVGTSFQYGQDRKYGETVFDEKQFLELNTVFYKMTGNPLFFISVINEDNFEYCIKTVELAKDINSFCRLNPQFKIGRAESNFPVWKMIGRWLQIMDLNLGEYEYTCRNRKKGNCFFNTQMKCGNNIKTVYFKNNVMNIQICDFSISKNSHMSCADRWLLKDDCITCRFKNLCNNCQTLKESISDTGIEQHCEKIKEMSQKLIKYDFYI